MTTILIDIKTDGEFCGDCHLRPHRYCEAFKPHELVQNGRRVSHCLAAEIREHQFCPVDQQGECEYFITGKR